ncbi:MAG: serine/threonine-protein kinase, partial [Gemmataceae bacterium]
MLRPEHHGRDDLRRRFLNEARIAARLQHPSIVPVHDLGDFPDGRPFFTMRLIHGNTLAALLTGRPGPDANVPHLIKVFEKVCQAMAYAHAGRVIHRDLKPGNIMVAPYGVVKVMDWGVAKELLGDDAPDPPEPPPAIIDQQSDLTELGRVLGTPAYMAPEQARGEPVDERADVFGLGAILCEILTGLPPYGTADGRTAHRRAARGDLRHALRQLAACPAEPAVVDLARACLAADAAG